MIRTTLESSQLLPFSKIEEGWQFIRYETFPFNLTLIRFIWCGKDKYPQHLQGIISVHWYRISHSGVTSRDLNVMDTARKWQLLCYNRYTAESSSIAKTRRNPPSHPLCSRVKSLARRETPTFWRRRERNTRHIPSLGKSSGIKFPSFFDFPQVCCRYFVCFVYRLL